MRNPIAQTVATLAIWFSTMITFVGGVFRANWNGDNSLKAMTMSVVAIAAAAAVSTAFVWHQPRPVPPPEPARKPAPEDEWARI